jgi:hypothetical protein
MPTHSQLECAHFKTQLWKPHIYKRNFPKVAVKQFRYFINLQVVPKQWALLWYWHHLSSVLEFLMIQELLTSYTQRKADVQYHCFLCVSALASIVELFFHFTFYSITVSLRTLAGCYKLINGSNIRYQLTYCKAAVMLTIYVQTVHLTSVQ